MIKVLAFSDSHGRLTNIEKVLQRSGKVDMVIHLGDIGGQEERLRAICDCPVKIVRGNCDFGSSEPYALTFNVGSAKIFASHGHLLGVNYTYERIYYTALENECNVAMFGHTHEPVIKNEGKVVLVNPGSVERPRQCDGQPTYLLLEIDDSDERHFTICKV